MSAHSRQLTPTRIRRTLTYRWVCLGLLYFSGLLAFFTRLAPAVAVPDLGKAFMLMPFRNAFAALFFVTIGALMTRRRCSRMCLFSVRWSR